MKKLFTFFCVIAIILTVSSGLFAGDRMVIIEKFTSWTCPPCASNNPIMDAWFLTQDPDKVLGIAYHMNWPPPGNDGYYLANPVDNTTRRNYYGVNAIPQAFMDGIINIQSPYSQGGLTSYFNLRKDSLAPVTVIVRDSLFAGDSVLVRAIIYCEMPLQNPNVMLQFAVLEKSKTWGSPPGTNGETSFKDIMRLMPFNANGAPITLYAGQTQVFERRYRINPSWGVTFNDLKNVVFVQAGNKESMQAGAPTQNFTLLPNPGYRIVNQGSSQSANYRVRVPYTASGYNSNITFSAEVNPPMSGVTVSFPNGNVMSNFSDSVLVQVASTGSVPTGAYRIIVTGTNTNNKIHKTTFSYLVGQNYIYVGANRTGADYKVNNVTYNSSQLFTWSLGTNQTLEAVSPQTTGNQRLVYHNWSNGGSQTQTVNINANTGNFTVNYKMQYRLVGSVEPSDIPVTTTGLNSWYDSSATANINVSPLQLQWNNQTWYFQRWEGTGSGSYTGPNPNVNIQINGIIIQTAIYDTIAPIGIHNLGNEIPKTYELDQNYPNPFNPTTKVKFGIPTSADVKIIVYDVLGNEVAVLANEFLSAGYYEIDWNASLYASGVYFYKMETPSYTNIKRMVLVK